MTNGEQATDSGSTLKHNQMHRGLAKPCLWPDLHHRHTAMISSEQVQARPVWMLQLCRSPPLGIIYKWWYTKGVSQSNHKRLKGLAGLDSRAGTVTLACLAAHSRPLITIPRFSPAMLLPAWLVHAHARRLPHLQPPEPVSGHDAGLAVFPIASTGDVPARVALVV